MSKYIVDLNTVGQVVLENLDGVGTGLAARIIDYRDKHGPFNVWDDLRKIPGMTNAAIDNLKQHGLTLGRRVA